MDRCALCVDAGYLLAAGGNYACGTKERSEFNCAYPALIRSLERDGVTLLADLFVRRGAAPTTSAYDCRPYKAGNAETCTFNSPVAATYYVNVRAYAAYSGVSLKGTSN